MVCALVLEVVGRIYCNLGRKAVMLREDRSADFSRERRVDQWLVADDYEDEDRLGVTGRPGPAVPLAAFHLFARVA